MKFVTLLNVQEHLLTAVLYKEVRRNFTKFTVKHLCGTLDFDKVAGSMPLI